METLLAHAANYTLSFFMWMLIGQQVLRLISGGRRTLFSEVFRLGTAPIVWPIRRITPPEIGDVHVTWFALMIVVALRLWLSPWLVG